MPTLTVSDKRREERVGCFVPVVGKEGSVFDQTQTVDFSRGGLGFISKKEIPLNKEIAIEINLGAEEDPVFVIGQVCWIRPVLNSDRFRIGINFKDVLRGSKARLKEYFDR